MVAREKKADMCECGHPRGKHLRRGNQEWVQGNGLSLRRLPSRDLMAFQGKE